MDDKWRELMSKSKWLSSYEINGYGDLFYSLVKILKPGKIVELGTKAGYSTYFMAKALKENGSGSSSSSGTIDAYDLWEKYQFTSCPKSAAEENLKEVLDVVNLFQEDVMSVEKKYDSIDILHVDLGNCGELLDGAIIPWLPKVKQMIIIEGGSEERDKVDWIKKFNKTPIREWFVKHKDKFDYLVIEPFPSVTLIIPKH